MVEQNLVAVVIPIYKNKLSASEKASLLQCKNILNEFDRIIIKPKTLVIDSFIENQSRSIQNFEDGYFKNIAGYNNLMLSPEFYDRFKAYKFILIYQLDAWVFKNELMIWCKQNYDYIGAPDIAFSQQGKGFSNVLLNGGLSLRKVKPCWYAAKIFQLFWRSYKGNEDAFFSAHFTRFYPISWFLKLPNYQTALNFAYEKNPSLAHAQNQGKMPFGCHAFEKYEPDFWAEKIKY